ncbi:MAG: flavodoxin domain-containing protein [Bacteroidota bacterium]
MSAVSIFYGSVFGNAQNAAERTKEHLESKGIESKVVEDPTVDDLVNAEFILAISSTCGLGDVPPNLEDLVTEAREQKPDLTAKPFAVAALGDSNYDNTFCGGGKQVFEMLKELNGKAVQPLLEIDAIETFEPDEDIIQWVDGFIHQHASS